MSKVTIPSDKELFEAFVDEQKKLHREHADDADSREKVRHLEKEVTRLSNELVDDPRKAQSLPFQIELTTFKLGYIDISMSAETAVRGAAACAGQLAEKRARDSADTLFHLRFLIFFGHCALDDFVADLKEFDREVVQDDVATVNAASHLSERLRLNAFLIQAARLWENETMRAKELFELNLAFAEYYKHSCAIRQKLLDARAGKTEGTDDLEAQIRQLKKMRQPFEDVIKSAADNDNDNPTLDSAIRSLRGCQEQLKDMGFKSGQTTFQKMLKIEERWEKELGFGKK